MKEEKMFNPMINYLKMHGYNILEEHRAHEHGTDIIAEKNNRKLYLELKGDSTNPDVDFGTLIYQIMKNFNLTADAEYWLGISEKYEKYAIRCKQPLEKLGIRVHTVSESDVKLLF
jgi:Holliday junction resolvase-like predicted endonuclease